MLPQLVKGDSRHKDNVIFWLAFALIIVSVSLVTAIAFIIRYCLYRRWQRYQTLHEGDSKPPTLRNPEGLLQRKKRTRSLEDRLEEEELQRAFIIRKAYASRASLRTDSIRTESQLSNYSNNEDPESTAGEHTEMRVGDEGKARDARLSRKRCDTSEEMSRTSIQDSIEMDLGLRASTLKGQTPVTLRHSLTDQGTQANGILSMIEETDLEESVPRGSAHGHSR